MKEVYANGFPLSIVNICFCLPVVGSHCKLPDIQ